MNLRKNKKISKKNNPYWNQLHSMEKQIHKAWNKLNTDIKKKAPFKVIEKDNNQLMLLLGECNYIARECEKFKKLRK